MAQTEGLFEELVGLMQRLRGKHGCLWDKEQTRESLKPYLVEEAYEVLAAIEGGIPEHLREELGDLLFQIIFHAQIAAEQGEFDIYQIIRYSIDKMKRRHPHVFGNKKVKGTAEILSNWEKIKQTEKELPAKDGRRRSILEGVPPQLPALLRAHRVQEKAARVGFDHRSLEEVLDKLGEELEEFKQSLTGGTTEEKEEELGDLLFSLVNAARFVRVNPEEALRKTVAKFTFRFRYIEERVAAQGKRLDEVSLEEMDRLWEEAKIAPGVMSTGN